MLFRSAGDRKMQEKGRTIDPGCQGKESKVDIGECQDGMELQVWS